MAYSCNILADSIGPHGERLTTFGVTFPRFLTAEFNTHRRLSRNSSSSRAIPTEKLIKQAMEDPFIPEFNERVTGMGVGAKFTPSKQKTAEIAWINARDAAVHGARALLHVDKSRANRLLEPFLWQSVIASATEWDNFFNLRTDEGAQPEFRIIAQMMKDAYTSNLPASLEYGQWHLPLVPEPELQNRVGAKVSAGRCARISYNRHLDEEPEAKTISRWQELSHSGHWSPGEHPAKCIPIDPEIDTGNFDGFRQLRKYYDGEGIFNGV